MKNLPGSLSHQQQEAVLKTFTLLLGLSGLETINTPDDRMVLDNLLKLAAICQRDLLEAFPRLHQWLELWKDAGVS